MAGITSLEQLIRLGSVAAYVQVKRVEPKASLNLLWALEGAISGLHWQIVAKEHRTSLLLALESLLLASASPMPKNRSRSQEHAIAKYSVPPPSTRRRRRKSAA